MITVHPVFFFVLFGWAAFAPTLAFILGRWSAIDVEPSDMLTTTEGSTHV